MIHKAENVENYNFESSDKLLLDANIWLFIYGPQEPNDQRVAVYSAALAKMLAAKCQIYIDVLILSEFINRYARLKQNLISGSSKNFKQFRKSQEFKVVATEISDIVKRILNSSLRIESGLEEIEINNLIDEYGNGGFDFNDQMLLSLCKKKGFKLVTDDGDFYSHEVNLLTANKKLLN